MKDGAHFHVAMHKPAGRPCVVDAGDASVESPLHLRPVVVHRGVPFGARVIRTPHPGLHVRVCTPQKTDQHTADDTSRKGIQSCNKSVRCKLC